MSHLARRLRKKRHRSSPSRAREGGYRRNPPLFTDMLEQALPAGAGFVATRGFTKLGLALVERRWPAKSKHIAAAVSVASFLAAWFLGHRVKFLAKYHVPITAGAAIAAGINLVQIYIPKLGWFIGDPTRLTAGGTAAALAAGSQQALPDHLELVETDPTLYTWNDSYDGGRVAQSQRADPAAQTSSDPIAELLNENDDMGVFAGGMAGN